jgi:hypothetical protein
MKHTRFISIAASCLALGAVAAPAASARTDIGPPPAPTAQTQANSYEGLQLRRSAPVTAVARPHTPASVDLRSPDARDAARGVSVAGQSPAATSKSDDTDWGKIGAIGGSALGGLMLLGLGFARFTRRTTVLQR